MHPCGCPRTPKSSATSHQLGPSRSAASRTATGTSRVQDPPRSTAPVARVVLGGALVPVPVVAGQSGHELLRVLVLDLGEEARGSATWASPPGTALTIHSGARSSPVGTTQHGQPPRHPASHAGGGQHQSPIVKRSELRHPAGVAVRVRPAGPADGNVLAEMLVVAAFWRPDGPSGDVQSVLARPELAHYVAGWPRPGDMGVVAEDGPPVGAAWLRLLPEQDPWCRRTEGEASGRSCSRR